MSEGLAVWHLGHSNPHAWILHRDRSGGVARLSEIRPGNASPVVVQPGPDLGDRLGSSGVLWRHWFEIRLRPGPDTLLAAEAPVRGLNGDAARQDWIASVPLLLHGSNAQGRAGQDTCG